MSSVGIILVTFAVDPRPLLDSAISSKHSIRWYIYHHGPRNDVELIMIDRASKDKNILFKSYRKNRGLAKSWNKGLRRSINTGNNHSVIANDDLFFSGGVDEYIDWLDGQGDYGIAFVKGLESGGSPFAGEVRYQGLSCAAIGAQCVRRVGYFDEAFVPAYFEDCDYLRRVILAQTPMAHSEQVFVTHARSSTIRAAPEAARAVEAARNRSLDYYRRKWGGAPDAETFDVPFDRPAWSDPLTWHDRNRYGRFRRLGWLNR